MDKPIIVCTTPISRRRTALKNNDGSVSKPYQGGSPSTGEEGLIGKKSVLHPVSMNVALTGVLPSLESKATRQVRAAKRAWPWGSLKAKMKPAVPTHRGSRTAKRHLLDLTITDTPRTPEGVFRFLNAPFSQTAFCTPRSARRRYRDPAAWSPPYTPVISSLRRSERIASRSPTPVKDASQNQLPRRLRTPGRFENDLSNVTSRLDALANGLVTFETMEEGISRSLEKQDSSCVAAKTNSTEKKDLTGKRTSSLTSLKESLHKRLKKLPADTKTTTEVNPDNERKTTCDSKEGTVTNLLQRKRANSLSNLKESLHKRLKKLPADMETTGKKAEESKNPSKLQCGKGKKRHDPTDS